MKTRAPLVFDPKKIANAETGLRTDEQTRKRANTKTKAREGRQFIAAHVLPEAAKQFKLMTVQQERTTQSMLIEAINDLFAKYGMSRLADG